MRKDPLEILAEELRRLRDNAICDEHRCDCHIFDHAIDVIEEAQTKRKENTMHTL